MLAARESTHPRYSCVVIVASEKALKIHLIENNYPKVRELLSVLCSALYRYCNHKQIYGECNKVIT